MAQEVRLPQLGQTMEEGTIVGCRIKVGDEIRKGDVIFDIETDKATLEMESPAAGFVKHVLVEVDQTLLVGAPLLVLGDRDEQVPESFIDSLMGATSARPAEAEARPTEQATAEPVSPEPAMAAPRAQVIASPRAKTVAKELGVDIASITPTGPGGKITEQDVRDAAEAKASAPAETTAAPSEFGLGQTLPLNRLQKITGERMLQSKREIPCFYLSVKADMTDLVELRAKLNKSADVKISYNDFLMRAVAIGLGRFPMMTGQLAGESIRLATGIGIGLAIAVPGGLVAPIVKDVDKKDVLQIARDSKSLVEKARSNRLSPEDLEGGCITVTNLGASGIESFIPIVVPGQCSILGVGQITETCVPDSGNIVVRKLMTLTLSVDHKVVNGAYAAQFLDFVRTLLEDTSNFA
jgi:pyruvate dehydrogenase E2 component (dihydrolipoamide acetyltransferase)